MRVPVEWLHEYCAPHMDAYTLAERLALSGTEVERVEHHGVGAPENFVIGKVLERYKHPNADRLSVCMVDLGSSTPAQIVCGAPNVAAGQIVGVAKPGAVMPNGAVLGRAKLRGIDSAGMILAEDEVALGVEHNGIMVLDPDLAPGTPLAEVLPIATDVLVLEITPNRPDCLGIYGVAREVAACTGAQLKPAPWEQDLGTSGKLDGIEIVNLAGDELCPRFTARIFEHVNLRPSPYWLKGRLMAAGQRPISNVVDITNYVMLLTGQPMHAFDYEKVSGRKLTIRRARDGEQIDTLDGQTRTLDSEMVLIEDGDGPTSIAGVMGGARSEVDAETTSVLTEVATWNGANIHRTSLALGLRSEASSRYEKQLQVEQTEGAQALATKLLVELAGAGVREGTLVIGPEPPAPLTVQLREQRMNGLLGLEIELGRARQLLEQLGFTVSEEQYGLSVTVPSFRRADVTREADLIEEVVRCSGVDKLPATLPARRIGVGALTPQQRLARRAADAATAEGLYEVVGWSFTSAEAAQRLGLPGGVADSVVKIANPLSAEQAQLRTTLLGSLLDIARYNHARGVSRLRLFETGAVYHSRGDEELPLEPQHLAALVSGTAREPTWREPEPPLADFFTVKGMLSGIFRAIGVNFELTAAAEPFLHPGRTARVIVDGREIGWLGEVHPTIAGRWGLEQTVAAFEIDLGAIAPTGIRLYEELPSFPEVREDIAVIVGDGVGAADVVRVVLDAGRPLAVGAEVFDVYRDAERLGEDKVSLAVRVSYQAADRTLTDAEVARQREFIVGALKQELGGIIRGE
jgi:phenylalanyl-tRNA synthetase beta chain